MEIRTVAIIYLIVFLVGLTFVSIWSARQKSQGSSDAVTEHFLGGKKIPFFVLGMSYCASFASAGAFMGDPALVSLDGYPWVWMMIASIPGPALICLLLIRKMKIQCDRLGVKTPVEYVSVRFDSKFLRILMAVICTCCFFVTIIGQLKASTVLLVHFLELDFNLAIVLVAAAILLCTIAGGLRSVAWTDALQGIVMALLCISLCLGGIITAGGFKNIDAVLEKFNPDMIRVVSEGMFSDYGILAVIGMFLFGMFIMPAQPYLTARYMALGNLDRKLIGKYTLLTLIFTALFVLNFFNGLSGRALFPDAEADYIVVTLATGIFPPVISCVMMIGLFAAIVSTATSMLLTAGQSVGRDILTVFKSDASLKLQVNLSNITCAVIVVAALIFNYVNTPALFQLFNIIGLTGVGASLAMPLYMGVLYKKSTKEAAIASALTGIIATIICQIYYDYVGLGLSMGIPIVCAALAFFIVNAIVVGTKGVDPRIQDRGAYTLEPLK